MGKKTKVGKQRKDKYYHLAKETGYRSRAAFKLIQLNRKFGFLQKSRVCIDLCAAPGGWMQVAHENMPLSSIVVGIDLFPIKTVSGCISLVEDITTDKCKTALTKELKTWKADVVLNDGAPNVGLNWIHDAYQQACLTLSALKLATNFLKPGGWFITKVFRSKDYHALIWVFKQLFKKVHATKPQASRNESSEIFVVCQHYIAPDHIDPKFLDAKYVFEEIDLGLKNKLNILHPEKQKKAKAEGYKDNDYTLHHQVPVSDFLLSGDPIEALRGCSEIIFDDKEVESHELTTKEIKECCKDIKLLGRKDVKALLKWLKAMTDIKSEKDKNKTVKEVEVKERDVKGSDDEEDQVDAQIAELQEEERRDLKRKRKQLTKQRVKLAEKMNLKMVVKSDSGPTLKSTDLFQLKDIKSMKDIDKVAEQQPDILAKSDDESDDDTKLKPKYMKYNSEDTHLDSSGKYYKDSDSELEMESDSSDSDKETLGFSDSDEEKSNKKLKKLTKKNTIHNAAVVAKKGEKEGEGGSDDSDMEHPLLPSLDTAEPRDRRHEKAQMWFQKDSFKDLDDDEDEDIDLDKLADSYKRKGKNISQSAINKESTVITKTKKQRPSVTDSGVSSDDTDTDTDSDYDVEETVQLKEKESKHGKTEKAGRKANSNDTFEIVSQDKQLKGLKKLVKMDQETLAMGTMMATSKKYKRDLVDNAWNRYTFDDKNLPDWFVEDESKNMRKPVEVTKEVEEEYRNRLQEINSRPIKKVIEAKARKKKRMVKKMERAKKKVEAVMENGDMSEREKAKQVKQLYKKAHADPKKDVTYVVAKKHSTGARVRRPAGVKGQYRVVDARMKKDLRAARNKEKTKGRKKTSSKKGNARPNKQKSK